MHFVFIMDPPSTVLVDADTTFALMLEAQARGHRVDHCLARDISLRGDQLQARTRRATMQRDPQRPVTLGDEERVDLDAVDAVFIRTDPPFDATYLYLTLLLDRLEGKTLVVNRPAGVRGANE
jgi:glutathione synthase